MAAKRKAKTEAMAYVKSHLSISSAEPTSRDIEADVCTALRAAGFSTSVLTPSGKVEVVSERIERIAAVVAKVVKP
jgi:hypothetical protein